MSIFGNATWLFRLFKISCLFIALFENVMGFFTLKTQIKCSPRRPPEPLCIPLGVGVPQFGNRCVRPKAESETNSDGPGQPLLHTLHYRRSRGLLNGGF